MESTIYTVPQLTRIVRVVGNHVPTKARFKFSDGSFVAVALFSLTWFGNL
jgi:hypothetical protein